MLRLNKKTAPAVAISGVESTESSTTVGGDGKQEQEKATSAEGTVSLLGSIGGVKVESIEGKKPSKKRTPGEIRIQKDIAELDSGTVAQIHFPNPNDLTNFNVAISPDSGYWAGARYVFSFVIPGLYPHEPPKVTCDTKIYHPNINLEGAVCLNILREEWKPVLDINVVIYGLIYLFYEPNPDDPLNREAADLFRTDRKQFATVVKRTMQGHSYAGESFPRLI